ncbi:hypothetical protein EM595_2862 [Duffyella gerundensis]|uniref:Uncharacterized protein n=1 Tax=Duffyella gerundensis TaxID=1619313 RepID=A0A0U5L7P9_9GAMM|nr:hypothetical protein EM595_2862 [Duffyella gerundensis]
MAGYPIFLWINRCKILFIVDDKLVKVSRHIKQLHE